MSKVTLIYKISVSQHLNDDSYVFYSLSELKEKICKLFKFVEYFQKQNSWFLKIYH